MFLNLDVNETLAVTFLKEKYYADCFSIQDINNTDRELIPSDVTKTKRRRSSAFLEVNLKPLGKV